MNKKLLALLLAILMVAMSAVAMAATKNQTTLSDITKIYETDTVLPQETLTFTADASQRVNPDGTTVIENLGAPQLSGTINTATGMKAETNAEGAATGRYTGTLSITTDESWSAPGTYTYSVSETAGNIQGVTYSTEEIAFQVLVGYKTGEDGKPTQELEAQDIQLVVAQGAEKKGSITNKYESGSVYVSKTVDGNAADTQEDFTVELTFAPETDKAFTSNFTSVKVNGTDTTLANNKITITVKHGDTITISDIPLGASVTAAETGNNVDSTKTNPNKYWPMYKVGNVETATATADDTSIPTIAITNYRSSEIATGVTTDSMPYILLMAFVAILAVAFVAKKRSVKE